MAKKKTSKKKIAKKKTASRRMSKPVRRGKVKISKKSTPKRAKPQAARASQKKQEPQTPPPKVGSFVWHELMTPDVPRAKQFYSQLFGWKMIDEEMMPGFIYTMMMNKGDGVGGMMAIAPEQGDIKPHWMVYVSVKDVDAIAEQTEAMGGEVVVPPHDIPVGRWALLKDPTGAAFAVYKSAKR